MSLVVDLAVLSEGAATDSRGNITLVGANPQLFIAESFPVQFSPFLMVALKDDEASEILAPGRTIAGTVEAIGPDGDVLFVFPLTRAMIAPTPYPALKPRAQVVGQVPFTASKAGDYTVSARITVISESGQTLAEVSAGRTVRVTDLPSLKAKAD